MVTAFDHSAWALSGETAPDEPATRQTRVTTVDRHVGGDGATHLTDAQFEFFRDLARRHAGIVIADFKRSMVLRRISKRLKALDLKSVADYCSVLSGGGGPSELQLLINALTTNKTQFFREAHHFTHLRTAALSAIIERKCRQNSRRLRVWSAGCSTGEEAWSLAMTIEAELAGRSISDWDVKILATDIDTEVLARAQSGRYDRADLDAIPVAYREQGFVPVAGKLDQMDVRAALRRLVVFKPLNLHGSWPFNGPFDIIFCRNVVIYFDRPTQRVLFNRMADVLADGGYLYCGHSESLHGITTRFEPAGRSVYEKLQ